MEFLIGEIDFGEGPRWRDGQLWYSDFYQAAIYRVSPDGRREAVFTGLSDRPSGLGWRPDGILLIVSMHDHRLLQLTGDGLELVADISE